MKNENKNNIELNEQQLEEITGGANVEYYGGLIKVELAPGEDPFSVLIGLKYEPGLSMDYASFLKVRDEIVEEINANGYTKIELYTEIQGLQFHINDYKLS